jgi:hypothetical protein
MKRCLGLSMAAVMAMVGSLRAVDLEAPLVQAPEPVKMEPIRAPQAPAAAIEQPAVSVGEDCADGRCPVKGRGKIKSDDGCLNKLWNFLTYKPSKGTCDCYEPTPYHPPLYTYFGCRENNCRTGVCEPTMARMAPLPVVVAKKTEEPLRMPEMPKLAGPVNPLISGSSSAMAEKREASATMTTTLKMAPVILPQR